MIKKIKTILISQLFSFVFIFMSIQDAMAHPFDIGLLHASITDEKISFFFQLDPKAASQITGVHPENLMESKIQKESDLLFAATLGEAQITLKDHSECKWSSPIASVHDEKVNLSITAICPKKIDAWSLKFPMFSHVPSTFEIVAKIQSNGNVIEKVATIQNPSIEISAEKSFSWGQFIRMGIKHIGALPSEWKDESGFHFPDGIDHILFVIALVLSGGGLIGVLKTVTGFTLGHSVTLALATLGLIHIPSRIIESAIALSIAIVAAESIFSKKSKSRWKIAMAFGLIHGLGFASALSDLKLSGFNLLHALIGFNVGVEIGQAVIVILLFPVFYILGRNIFAKRYILPGFATVIFLIGAYWFIQRAFGI